MAAVSTGVSATNKDALLTNSGTLQRPGLPAEGEYITYGEARPWVSELSEAYDGLGGARRTTILQGRKTSLVTSVLNVMNAIMGSGILALPSVMASTGWLLFLVVQVVMMAVVDFSLHLLLRACRERGKYSYEELGYEAFGIAGKRLVCCTIVVQNTGAILSYLIVSGDLLPSLLKNLVGDGDDDASAALSPPLQPPLPPTAPPPSPPSLPWPPTSPPLAPPPEEPFWQSRSLLMCAATVLVILPLGISPKIGFLGYSSILSFSVMVLLGVLTVVEYTRIDCSSWGGCPVAVNAAIFSIDVALAIPVLTFSFVCHTAFLPVLSELREADEIARTRRSSQRLDAVGHIAVLLAGGLYLLAAFFGYFTFGANVKSDLWLSYIDIVPNDHFVLATRALFLLAIIATVPIILFPMRKTIFALVCPSAPFSWSRHIGVTTVLLALLLGVAILLPEIKSVFSVVGATSSVMLVFILPGTIFLRTVPVATAGVWTRAGAKALVAVGPCVAVVALVAFFTSS